MNNLSDLNLNNDTRTLDLLDGAIRLGLGLYSYLWYSDALPKNLQIMLSDVRTLIKSKYRNQWLEELRMTRKQNSTKLSRTMLTQDFQKLEDLPVHRSRSASVRINILGGEYRWKLLM